jgi:hypothetical protein
MVVAFLETLSGMAVSGQSEGSLAFPVRTLRRSKREFAAPRKEVYANPAPLCWFDPADPDRYRPDHCPQCEAHRPLRAHGFYTRTLVDIAFAGGPRSAIPVLLLQTHVVAPAGVALPYLRFGIVVIALFLVARLVLGLTLNAATESAKLAAMPYQRGQFWGTLPATGRELSHAIVRIWSAFDFIPEALAFEKAEPGTSQSDRPGSGRIEVFLGCRWN